jgi:hypothetical protein
VSQNEIEPLAWSRRDGESQEQYALFSLWLAQPQPRPSHRQFEDLMRDLFAAGRTKIAPVSYRTYHRIAVRHDWDRRSNAFDSHMARVELVSRERAIAASAGESELESYREKIKKRSRVVGELGALLMDKLSKHIAQIPDGGGVASNISSGVRAAKEALQFELDWHRRHYRHTRSS